MFVQRRAQSGGQSLKFPAQRQRHNNRERMEPRRRPQAAQIFFDDKSPLPLFGRQRHQIIILQLQQGFLDCACAHADRDPQFGDIRQTFAGAYPLPGCRPVAIPSS